MLIDFPESNGVMPEYVKAELVSLGLERKLCPSLIKHGMPAKGVEGKGSDISTFMRFLAEHDIACEVHVMSTESSIKPPGVTTPFVMP